MPGDHGEQRGKKDDAVAHTLQPHGQPPAWTQAEGQGYTHAQVSFSETGFLLEGGGGGAGGPLCLRK